MLFKTNMFKPITVGEVVSYYTLLHKEKGLERDIIDYTKLKHSNDQKNEKHCKRLSISLLFSIILGNSISNLKSEHKILFYNDS